MTIEDFILVIIIGSIVTVIGYLIFAIPYHIIDMQLFDRRLKKVSNKSPKEIGEFIKTEFKYNE